MEGDGMTTMTENAVATQAYQVYIKASPEAIWDAITRSERTQQYGYRSRVDDLKTLLETGKPLAG
jgi:uncharacterized protein YndB with AHSA1/START domain